MIDLDRELRVLLEEDAHHAPVPPQAGPAIRRARRRQVEVVLTTLVMAAAVVAGSIAGVSALIRSSERRTPAEPPETFQVGPLETVPAGSTSFGGLTIAADGTVWGTGPGLNRFDPASGGLSTFTVADDPALGDVWLQGPAADGGVWISSTNSYDGVMRRFDGGSIAETLAPGPINAMAEAPDGTVWGTGAEGLFRWDGASWMPVPSDGLALDGAIAVDRDGNVWVANVRYPGPTAFGVSRFDGGSWSTWTASDGLPSDEVYTIVPGPDGEVWIGTADGAARFRDGSWTPYPSEVTGVQHVISMAVTRETVVIAGRQGEGDVIARFDGSAWLPVTAEDGLEAIGSSWVEVASGSSGLWATTDAGLFRFDGVRWQPAVPAGKGPSNEMIRDRNTSVAAADADTLWVATGEDGVWRLQADAWAHFGVVDGLPSNRVGDVAVAADGTVWAATDGGLARFDGARWEEVAPGAHAAIAFAPDGTVWSAMASDGKTSARWVVGPVGGTALPDPVKVDLDGPRALAVGPGNDVWIGGSGSWIAGGLAHLDGRGWTVLDRPTITPEYPADPNCSGFDGCDGVPVVDIVATPAGDVWVAFSLWAGDEAPSLAVARFDGETWQTYYDADGEPFAQAWYRAGDLDVTPSGRVLFATGGGLLEYRDGAWNQVYEGSFTTLSIAPDGAVWVGGDGLFRISSAEG